NGACDEPTSIGLSLPGRVTEREGTWIWSGDFPNWDDVPVAAPFTQDFGLPVAAISAGHAAAFAEFSFGAAQGIADILYVRVGMDIDASLLVRGRPFLVPQVSPGQAGHMVIESGGPRCACGDTGCWQALAGREALIARVVKGIRSGSPSAVGASVDGQFGAITPALIVRMAAAGDAVARRALDETGRCLALGLANLIALFGPQAVIVDSQPPAVGAALLRAAEKALKSSPRAGLLAHCVLLSPELGESAPVLGAAAWAARSAS
ncbi:MAG TPA: ROK family protein, partial [Armatimonadota bacterium]|nr:ROK family protein [Armatimonadota bacterium]